MCAIKRKGNYVIGYVGGPSSPGLVTNCDSRQIVNIRLNIEIGFIAWKVDSVHAIVLLVLDYQLVDLC